MWSRNTLWSSQVKNILNSMVVALSAKRGTTESHVFILIEQFFWASIERKYTQVEIAFFKHWWESATQDQKDKIKSFIKNGQLEFNLGGITMNDESCPTYYEVRLFHSHVQSHFHVTNLDHSRHYTSSTVLSSWLKIKFMKNEVKEYRSDKTIGDQSDDWRR